ncbi:unnamed protein product [Rhodiola kirilowii]
MELLLEGHLQYYSYIKSFSLCTFRQLSFSLDLLKGMTKRAETGCFPELS